MMNYGFANYGFGHMWNQNFMYWLPFLSPLILLDLVLKGFALWRAARNKQLYWFIALLVINSVGILPVIYLLITQKKTKSK